METFRINAATEKDTRAVAAKLGKRARGGDALALYGTLGAGKTTFAQGFVRGAGMKVGAVSPTFALAREYRFGRRKIHHLDLFRLAPADVPNIGLEDYFNDAHAVCLVEWPEAAASRLPPDRLEVSLSHLDPSGRSLNFRAMGPRARRLLAALESDGKVPAKRAAKPRAQPAAKPRAKTRAKSRPKPRARRR